MSTYVELQGHRLEFQKPNDATSDLEFKGIVFNEMKGAMAESGRVFQQEMSAKLFPTVTYHHNSGAALLIALINEVCCLHL